MGEALCKAYRDEYGVDMRIGRIFNSYGPRLRAEGFYGRGVSRFLLQALKREDVTVFGDGSQTRSFCYVTDTETGLLQLVSMEGVKWQLLNIGSLDEARIIDLARKNIELPKSKIGFQPFPPGDHRRRLPETERARKAIRWGPKVSLEEGLERTLEWIMQKNPAR